MMRLLSCCIIPVLIIAHGLFAYFLLSQGIATLEPDPAQLLRLEAFIEENPVRTVSCGVQYTIEAEKALGATVNHMQNGANGLLEVTIGLFVLAVIREINVYKSSVKNS